MTQTVERRAALYATPLDASAHGEYRPRSGSPTEAVWVRGRVTDDGSSGFAAESDRYHLYAGWSCPLSHRLTIQLAMRGLGHVVSVSYVDGLRDGRGWAFRERTGPDQVNGFTLLRQAYEATQPGYAADVSIPVLWDRRSGRIVSNDPSTIAIDLATQFAAWADPAVDSYAVAPREGVEVIDATYGSTLREIGRAMYDRAAADRVTGALRDLDQRLASQPFLLGEQVSDADIRLWVLLVRYDAGGNAHGAIGPRLDAYPNLWRWAQNLYALPAFADTTNFAAFSAPFANVPNWGS
jgi:glutathionyl-hydroquinone reductase